MVSSTSGCEQSNSVISGEHVDERTPNITESKDSRFRWAENLLKIPACSNAKYF
jgi:hypothetical protein